MQIDDATRIVIEQNLGNDLPEVSKECPLSTEALDSGNFGSISDLGHVRNLQPCGRGPRVDWGWAWSATSSGCAWWRGDHGNDLESWVGCDRTERRDRKATAAKEDQATTCDYALATPCGAVQRRLPLVNHRAPRRRPHRRR